MVKLIGEKLRPVSTYSNLIIDVLLGCVKRGTDKNDVTHKNEGTHKNEEIALGVPPFTQRRSNQRHSVPRSALYTAAGTTLASLYLRMPDTRAAYKRRRLADAALLPALPDLPLNVLAEVLACLDLPSFARSCRSLQQGTATPSL